MAERADGRARRWQSAPMAERGEGERGECAPSAMAECGQCAAAVPRREAAAHTRRCAALAARFPRLRVPSPPPSPPPPPSSLPALLAAHRLAHHLPALRAARVRRLPQLRSAALPALPLPLGAKRKLAAALVPPPSPPPPKRRAAFAFPPPPSPPPPRPAPRPAFRVSAAPPPPSHRVAATAFYVDAFSYALPQNAVAFLTHFHADHYNGLPKSLPPNATIHCTSITAALTQRYLRVPSQALRPLQLHRRYQLVDPFGKRAHVWLFDANHCPGAVVLLFFVLHTKKWTLHTGDFRYHPPHFNAFTALTTLVQTASLHYLHLDTTYCSPNYVFPPQQQVIQTALHHARQEDKRTKRQCLFFFGTYSIGKERVFMHVANELNLHIYASKRKRDMLSLLQIPSLQSRLVSNPAHARIHLVPMNALNPPALREYLKRNSLSHRFIGRALIVCFRPTGWTFNRTTSCVRSLRPQDNAVVFQLPYSEHSSFAELRAFVKWLNPRRLIPMVGATSPQNSEQMKTMLAHRDRPLVDPHPESPSPT